MLLTLDVSSGQIVPNKAVKSATAEPRAVASGCYEQLTRIRLPGKDALKHPLATARGSAGSLLATDTVKTLLPTDKDVSIGDGRRCINWFTYRVCGQYFVLRSSLYHEGVAVFTGH